MICFDAAELEIKERYIRANPRRWALRDVPEGRFDNMRYKGNLALLKEPGKRLGLRISRKATEEEISRCSENILAEIGRDSGNNAPIVFSTFYSPGERACLELLLCGSARLAWVLPTAMPEKIPVPWTDAFIGKRALWLSEFSDEVKEASRLTCEEANRILSRYCEIKKKTLDSGGFYDFN